MPELKCPVCGLALSRENRMMRCENGHSYDIAKQNYVNLLMSNQSSSKRHGDDSLMVKARQEFLDRGYYNALRDKLCELAGKYCGGDTHLLDAGCGEGWYTSAVRRHLQAQGKKCVAVGADISKQALIQAGKRDGELTLAVASVSRLPVMDSSCDLLLNIFAPADDGEFFRVLKPGGILLKAVPLERHLWGLKSAVYDVPYENEVKPYLPAGFEPLGREDVSGFIRLDSGSDIRALFMMTPYYYKTGAADQRKLEALESLETETEFGIFVLRRK